MKVFVSWSKDSREVAVAIHDVLPRLFDDADPFISTEIRAGTIWLPELEAKLSETDFGVICMTRTNSRSRWLHYEAGALSRHTGGKREVMPIFLVDIDSPTDVGGPLAGFQLTPGTKEGFSEIVTALNQLGLGKKIPDGILAERIEANWGRIADAIESTRHRSAAPPEGRGESEILAEVLQIVRGLALASSTQDASSDESISRLSDIILQKLSAKEGEAESWTRVDETVRYLARRVRRHFLPDFMVGVYPEGAFIGYLLWLDSAREWPFIMAPDADKEPLPEELHALGAKMAAHASSDRSPRCLVVDAAMKTGRTMRHTVEMVRQAAAEVNLDLEIQTLCLSVRQGYTERAWGRPDFTGISGDFELPFGD